MATSSDPTEIGDTDIAIVGMAAHLPGAGDLAEYWANLAQGVCSIVRQSEAALRAAGESPSRLARPDYVPFAAPLAGFADFDAEFFGFSPKEAAILDPQHRQFMEVAWEALENAGHPPEAFKGAIGVYAGCGMGSYFQFNLCTNADLVADTGMFLLRHTGNDKDFLATRVSHVLDLKGPSLSIQTACSTSLVAVHAAAQALLAGACDMALAGGVTIELPQGRGYLYSAGEILSPDGQCHAFDHRAQGTVFGSGAGAVALRRMKDAVADGDHIWAVIKGSAVNNDGAAKAGYLAPSVDGQARAIAAAQRLAGVSGGEVSYVECHGTGTRLGDPIEVAALTAAFRETTQAVGHCAIGSVKTNIGHTDTAAGVAGLIKVALALHHRQLPASLGFEAPNPAIDFAASPFRVNTALADWASAGRRVAGVNALGVGGTNAHAVVAEAPALPPAEPGIWPAQPLVLSARSRRALDAATARLAAHLRAHPEQPLADIAYTLKEGRRAFAKRRVLVAHSHAEAADLLETGDPRRVFTHDHLGDGPQVVFMFPGGGAQYAGMARDLYGTEPVFTDWMDQGLEILQPMLDVDLRALWLPGPGAEAQAEAEARLMRPSVQLPLIMITEYALAQLFISWGATPGVLVGHSMGENTAACLAGVMSFADCVALVHLRGALFDTVAPGGMLSVPMPEAALAPHLADDLDLASVNAPGLCVASGPVAALEALAGRLAAQGVETQRIAIDIAAHSRMLEPILARFAAFLRGIALSPPRLPVISNRSGQPLSAAEATSPDYWAGHLRATVQFQACMATLMAVPGRVYLEMGPGRALSSLAQANGVAGGQIIPALRHPGQEIADDAWHLATIARLWACGVPVDWEPVWAGARRRRVPLPGYPFQRKTYFIEPGRAGIAAPPPETGPNAPPDAVPVRRGQIAQWGWRPHWRPASNGFDLAGDLADAPARRWLIFQDDEGLGAGLATRLGAAGHEVISVRAGDRFAREAAAGGGAGYVLSPEAGREGYDLLLRDLMARGQAPDRIAHLWLVTGRARFRPGSSFFHRNLEQGFQALFFLAQAMEAEALPRPLHLAVLTSGAAEVRGEGLAHPEKATVLGPVRVIGQELPGVSVSTLDLVLPEGPAGMARLVEQVLEELLAEPGPRIAALRGERRFELGLKPLALPEGAAKLPDALPPSFPEGAHVLITGGFGGIGLTLAEDLARRHRARITLIARSPLPERALRAAGASPEIARRISAVERLQALGGAVEVATADVCNLEEMRAATLAATRRFGPVHTVIHAAGVVADAPLLAKTAAGVEEVLAPKLHGTRVLASLFPDGAIRQLVIFGSTSTVTGPAGQIDYVAANAYLNAYAAARAGGRTRVIALNWGIWADVGMAAEAMARRNGGGAGAQAASLLPGAPMLDAAATDAAGNLVFTAQYGAERWVLDGHRTASGQALIPGTGIVEIAAEALQAAAGGAVGAFEVQDLYLFRPLDVPDGTRREIRARLVAQEGGHGFELHAAAEVPETGSTGWQLHAAARLSAWNGPAPAPLNLAAIAARLGPPETGPGLVSPQEAHLAFGPRWRVLRARAFGTGEGLARLCLPDAFRGDLQEGWLLHPALMDLATGWAMGLIAGYLAAHLWVPVSCARIRVHRPLPADIASHVRNAAPNRADGASARFDITLTTPEGAVCVEIEGFTLRRLEGALAFAPPDPRGMEARDDPSHAPPLSAGEARLARALAQGIRPAEGAEAFARALAAGVPQLYVSSLDLPALIREAAPLPAAEGPAQGFARPDLDTAYLAPRDEVERRLCGFWQELLGVEQVGVEDSFFDLGGHSLIAVRLFAMVKKAWAVDFPISVLFEAPTVARTATLIRAQIGGPGGGQNGEGAPALARRFAHLVAMHPGDAPARAPFFLVAGMFGNVLNLRHLAQLMGGARPFYGLQARGLYGDAGPHLSLPDAARDYLAELRQIQPHGPYLLGGFSGGGLTAWEMAHQLEAAGEAVALLVLLDTPLPVRPALKPLDKALIKLSELREKGLAYLAEWARSRWEWERRRTRARPEAAGSAAFHNHAIERAFRGALPGYALPLRAGATLLLRPQLDRHWKVTGGRWVSRAREYVFPDNDLTRYAPALEVIEVPGDHDSMVLEPGVRVTAARLAAALAWREAAAPGAAQGAAGPQPAPPLPPLATAAE